MRTYNGNYLPNDTKYRYNGKTLDELTEEEALEVEDKLEELIKEGGTWNKMVDLANWIDKRRGPQNYNYATASDFKPW